MSPCPRSRSQETITARSLQKIRVSESIRPCELLNTRVPEAISRCSTPITQIGGVRVKRPMGFATFPNFGGAPDADQQGQGRTTNGSCHMSETLWETSVHRIRRQVQNATPSSTIPSESQFLLPMLLRGGAEAS
eukprot:1180826-Pyramimonas_sp.AAC.1